MSGILQWFIWLLLAVLMGVVAYWLIDDEDDCEEDS